MKAIHGILALVILTCVGGIGGCRPFSFLVKTPEAMQTGSQDFTCEDGLGCEGRIIITIEFSSDVDKTSVMAGANATLVLDEEDAPVDFTFSTDGPADVLVITTVQTRLEFCTTAGGCHLTLRLLGSGAGPIVDVDGNALDGDKNGEAGGDYETTFLLLG